MKSMSKELDRLAEVIDSIHGVESDWWRGYVAGMKRAASIVEIHEAFKRMGITATDEACFGLRTNRDPSNDQ